VHPGSWTVSDEAAGIAAVAKSLNAVLFRTRALRVDVLLENTAGQGTNLGWKFSHLGDIIAACRYPDRIGVCIDTCHAFAAGYDLATPKGYRATFRELDACVGLGRIRAFHLNDSKTALGARRDRHEHIGRGQLGLAGFENLLSDRRFSKTPMYLETPKGMENGEDLDVINLRTLRGLVRQDVRR
jgi:deoxyribonuclease-4